MKSKTIFLFLMCSLLLVSFASAGITDSVKYAPNELGVEDMKVELKSWWGFFEWLGINQTIGTLELKSHKNPDEVIKVGAGNQVTMYYDFNFKELYTKGLGEVIFIDMKTGKEVQRDYKFVYEFKEDKTREVCLEYEQILNSSVKGNETYSQGDCINSKTETYTETSWRDYNSLDIPKGIIRIGIEVNNRNNDYLDGIWIVAGKEITRHAPWNASLETGLVSWYKLDETSGTTAFDSVGSNNGTNDGATINQTGKIGTAYDFDGSNDFVDLTSQSLSGAISYSVWINTDKVTGYQFIVGEGGSTGGLGKLYLENDKLAVFPTGVIGTTSLSTNTWYHVVVTIDASNNVVIYLNGNSDKTGSITRTASSTNHYLGKDTGGAGQYFDGTIDEVAFWSRALSSTEILYLYENECTYQDCGELPLTINLTSPANNTFYTTTPIDIDFIGEIITEANMTNVSLIINTATQYTNTSGLNGTYTFTETFLSDGVYVWSIQGTTIENVSASSVNRTLTIDSQPPLLTASINNTILYKAGETILLNTTATDTNLDKVWYSYNGTNTTITGAVTGTLNQTTITTTFSALQIIVYANDTAGNKATPVTLTLSVDPTAPTITLAYPTSLIDYGRLNGSLQLNFTATDSNLDKVWYNYNGTNITIAGATSGVYNQSNITLSTNKSVLLCANDTAGNENCTSFSWGYKVFETARNFSATSQTTTLENFYLNFTTNTEVLPVVYLEYNGTEYLSTRTGNTTNHYAVNERGIEQAGNISLRWRITYGTTTIYTDYSYQMVSNVSSLTFVTGACGAGLTQVMNFTFADEQNLTTLENVTAKFNFKYGISDSEGKTAFGSVVNTAQVSLCINTSTSSTYEIGYGEVEYERTDYATRRFYVFDTTRISNVTINTILYMLPNAQSTSFLIEVRNPTLQPYSEVYTTLLRWYPAQNEYRVVEMGKTDDKGQTINKVKIEDADYRIGIYETDGSLIHMINPVRMVCLATPCSYTINIPTTSTNDFDEAYGIEAEIVWNNGTFTLTYNDPSQNTEIMSLQVYKISGTSNRLVCESNGTSFTGILTCDVSTESGLLKAIAVRTASPERPIAILIIDTLTTIFTGTFGLFLQFLIVVTLAFLGIVSPVVSIIMGIIALIFGVLVFKTLTYPTLIGIALLGGIVIHFLKRGGGQ